MIERRYIIAGNFIDGSGGAAQRKVFLKVEDGIITAIGSLEDLPRNDGIQFDDLSHCIVLPALVDCSVSLSQSPSVDNKTRKRNTDPSIKAALIKKHIHYCHIYGVQGIADTGSDLLEHNQDVNIVEIKSSGSLCGSRNCHVGDFLRIGYSSNVQAEDPPYPGLTNDDLCHILQHKGNRKAIVVANGPQHISDALEAGCDAIEQGYGMGIDNLKKMAEKNVLWIPSVIRAKNSLDSSSTGGSVCCRFSTRYVAPGNPVPGAEDFWEKMVDEQLSQLHSAKELGVKTALGTGAGSVGILHGESMVEEMKLFIKAGYSLEETIQSASENGARFLGIENLGMLTVGRKATFLIARGTAKQLPRKLSFLEGIYINGTPSTIYHKHPVITVS